MFCINCGREQKIGQKFCPICGTPFAVVDSGVQEKVKECQSMPIGVSGEENPEKLMDSFDALDLKEVEGEIEKKVSPETDVSNILSTSTQKSSALEDSPDGMSLNVKAENAKEKKDSLAQRIMYGFFAVCIFFGGKAACSSFDRYESDDSFDSSSSSSSSYAEEKADYGPDWLTSFRFDSEPSNGVVTSLSFSKDGTCVSSAHDRYTGQRMSFDGTFSVKGNTIYINLQGASSTIYFTIDNSRQRIVSSSGAVFKQSL